MIQGDDSVDLEIAPPKELVRVSNVRHNVIELPGIRITIEPVK